MLSVKHFQLRRMAERIRVIYKTPHYCNYRAANASGSHWWLQARPRGNKKKLVVNSIVTFRETKLGRFNGSRCYAYLLPSVPGAMDSARREKKKQNTPHQDNIRRGCCCCWSLNFCLRGIRIISFYWGLPAIYLNDAADDRQQPLPFFFLLQVPDGVRWVGFYLVIVVLHIASAFNGSRPSFDEAQHSAHDCNGTSSNT